MHECRGKAEVVIRIKGLRVGAQFNSNYKSGVEVLEDEACSEVLSLLPNDVRVEIEDVIVTDYQLLDAEREVEHED